MLSACFYLWFNIYWLVFRLSPCGCLNSQLWNASHTCTIQSFITPQINFIANLLCNKMPHYVRPWLIAFSCDKKERILLCEQCGLGYNRFVFQLLNADALCFLLQKSCPSAYLCLTARFRRTWWVGFLFLFLWHADAQFPEQPACRCMRSIAIKVAVVVTSRNVSYCFFFAKTCSESFNVTWMGKLKAYFLIQGIFVLVSLLHWVKVKYLAIPENNLEEEQFCQPLDYVNFTDWQGQHGKLTECFQKAQNTVDHSANYIFAGYCFGVPNILWWGSGLRPVWHRVWRYVSLLIWYHSYYVPHSVVLNLLLFMFKMIIFQENTERVAEM